MQRARREAAHRQRRVIFNNDGNEAVYFPAAMKPTAENVLALRVSPLADSHVDAIFYCTNRGFGMFLHRTKVGEVLTRETREKQGYYADKRNIIGDLLEQGTDPLQIMVDFARRHGKEVFWSMRMNDIHDAGNSSMLPRFKKEHPELLFGTPRNPPPFRGYSSAWGSEVGPAWGGYSGVDYAEEAVREFALAGITEVCNRYDLDGVELDFFRSPVLFKSHAWGKPVTEEERDALTDLLRRVRTMTEEVSLRRGRPVLIAIRVPDSVEYCHSIGIDLEGWLQEGLVDLLAVGGDFVLSSWEESVALGRKHSVPVYPVLTDSARHPIPEFRARSRPEGYRARALAAWQAGADGIYLFNLFDPAAPMWRELGDPALLRTPDKDYYVASSPLEQVTRYHPDGVRFCSLPTLSPEYPQTVTPARPLETTLLVSEDVRPGGEPAMARRLSLDILADEPGNVGQLTVLLNGHELRGGEVIQNWLAHAPKPEWINEGANRIEIRLSAGEAELQVRDVRLRISHGR